MTVEFSKHVKKPFMVEAVEITRDNIEELAPLIGRLKHFKDTNDPFIVVDIKKVPNVYRVYPGFWVTRIGKNIRCYSRKHFFMEFVENNEQIENWVKYLASLNPTIDRTPKDSDEVKTDAGE